jgi:hypothetical protein
MLNVSLYLSSIPDSQIKYVREIFKRVLTIIEDWNEDGGEETNKWLKRLEILPVVLFTIKGGSRERIKEMQRRIAIINDGKWNEITYEMVYVLGNLGPVYIHPLCLLDPADVLPEIS